MTALKRAVALAEMYGAALAVAENLNFDVARPLQIFFEIKRVVAEGRLGFGARHGRGRQPVRSPRERPSCRGRRRRRLL